MLILFSFLAKTRWCFLIRSLFWINSKAFCGRETSPHLQSFSSGSQRLLSFSRSTSSLFLFSFARSMISRICELATFTCDTVDKKWIDRGSLSSEGNPRYFPLLRVLFIHYTDEAYTRGGLCLLSLMVLQYYFKVRGTN